MTSQSVHQAPFLVVDLKTPYLTYSFEDVVMACGPTKAIIQSLAFGQEQVTLSSTRRLVSPNGRVVALTARGMNSELSGDRNFIPDLYIAGAVSEMEDIVMDAMNDGLLVARFSIFYRGPSDYTGRTAEEAGYAFDIPKSVDTVRRLLTDDDCLEAIAARNPLAIRSSLDELNKDFPNPILATPHLEVALSLPKSGRVLL
ncbi:hypothetical protein J4447_01270 [Candidatus Pacearchaeota archaeon]|nr:hypothetical protein [Candidatus Pacearchaeota archaeon]